MTTPVDVAIRMELLDNEVKRDVGQVRAEFQRLNRDVKSTGTAAKTTSSDYDRMRVAAAKLGDQVGTGLSRVLVAQQQHAGILSGSLGRLVTGYAALNAAQRGFTAVADIQDATKAFEGFVGSQREAAELTKSLQGINSPFGTSGILSGAQALLAHNTAARDVVPTLRAISDAVAGTGGDTSKLTAATQAIAELRSSTYLTSGALGQLTAQGIPAVDLLAKAHGMTAESLQRTLDAGGLRITGQAAADELLKGFTTRYKGQAAQQANSLRGVVTRLGNEASQTLATAIAPELPQITSFVNSLAADLPGLAHAASPFLHVLGDTLGFMADHPHLTEGLAGFLIFRQVAGPAIRTATAMYDIGRALKTIKSSEEVLLLLRSMGGLPGGLGVAGAAATVEAAAGKYGPGMPALIVPPGKGAKVAQAAEAGTRFGTGVGRVGAAGIRGGGVALGGTLALDALGHIGHPGRLRTGGQAAGAIGVDAATGAALGSFVPVIGTGVGALLGTGYGLLKHGGDLGHAIFGGGRAAAPAPAGFDVGGIHVNVTAAGMSAADLQAAAIASLSTPEARAQMQAQIDAQQRSAAARKQVPYS